MNNRDKTVRVGNVSEVVRNKTIRGRSGYFFSATESYYILDGKKISEKEFEKLYPVQLKPITNKGDNSDRTKNWMHGEKSY